MSGEDYNSLKTLICAGFVFSMVISFITTWVGFYILDYKIRKRNGE